MVLMETIKGNFIPLWQYFEVAFSVFFLILCAVGIDLYFGIKKSKKTGKYVHSAGLRRTTEKATQYLAFAFLLFSLDIINPIWLYLKHVDQFPILTVFGGIVLIYTEGKSIMEKTNDKFRKAVAQNPREIMAFVRDNIGLIKSIVDDIESINQSTKPNEGE